jgi:hypothetical protein
MLFADGGVLWRTYTWGKYCFRGEEGMQNEYINQTVLKCLAKLFGPLELCDLLPHFRLQT